MLRKVNLEVFDKIAEFSKKHNQNLKLQKGESSKSGQTNTSICRPHTINNQKCAKVRQEGMKEKEMRGIFGEREETASQPPLKQIEHKLIESCPEQCNYFHNIGDNNMIFLSNPFFNSN